MVKIEFNLKILIRILKLSTTPDEWLYYTITRSILSQILILFLNVINLLIGLDKSQASDHAFPYQRYVCFALESKIPGS